MRQVVKSGRFSSRYTYLRTSDGNYSLIDSTRVADPQDLIGMRVRGIPKGEARLSVYSGPKLGFDVTLGRLLWFFGALGVSTVIFGAMAPLTFIVVWSLVLHELGHMSVAFLEKESDLFFGAKLQYGVIPILYISNRRIYERTRIERIFYYSGGVLMNSAIGWTCFIAFKCWLRFWEHAYFLSFSYRFNFLIVMLNLYPLLFTDGFNILREIFQVYDLRRLVLMNFFRPHSLFAASRPAFVYYIFVIVSIVLIFVKLVFFVRGWL
ncbi:hypothetical protein AIF0345_2028 [Actinomyces israelii]|nr:hypothetical protein AIF0345_2028 [Actinomyces israelii]